MQLITLAQDVSPTMELDTANQDTEIFLWSVNVSDRYVNIVRIVSVLQHCVLGWHSSVILAAVQMALAHATVLKGLQGMTVLRVSTQA